MDYSAISLSGRVRIILTLSLLAIKLFSEIWSFLKQPFRLFVKRNFSRDGKNQAEKPRGRLKAVFGGG
jgi:hypothetical protein